LTSNLTLPKEASSNNFLKKKASLSLATSKTETIMPQAAKITKEPL